MAAALLRTTLAYRLQLYRSLASRLQPRLKPDDEKRKFARLSGLDADFESGSLVLLKLVKCRQRGCQFLRWELLGPEPPRLSSLNDLLEDMLTTRNPRPFLARMIVYGTNPDLVTFSFLVQYYCKQLTYRHVLDAVFTQMKAMDVVANDSFYVALMNGVCASFGPFFGYQLLKKLRSCYGNRIPPSCYNAVVRQFYKKKIAGDITMTLVLVDLLTYMRRHRVFPDEKFYKCILKVHNVLSNLRCYNEIDLRLAVATGRHMVAEGIKIGAVSPTCSQTETCAKIVEQEHIL